MNLWHLFQKLRPFVRPYQLLVIATLVLTLIGSLTAQVNALTLQYAVDRINALIEAGQGLSAGWHILITISAILLGKEIINAFVQFGQKFYGEKLRIFVSQDLAQGIIEKFLRYRLAFFNQDNNQAGKLQTRIDRGIGSLTRLVQIFFIDILPLFTSAIVALGLMYYANFYVGLVATLIVPIYFWLTYQQAQKLGSWRRNLRDGREKKSQGILSIINSITVIKSFNRESIEAEKQLTLQKKLTHNQMQTRQTSFLFDGLKSFIEQIGVVLIIILTAYFVLDRQMSIGMIMYHVLLFGNVSAPIRSLHRIYDEVNDAMIYSESFFQILEAEHEIEPSGTLKPVIRGQFDLQQVNFFYPNGHHALKDIQMQIQPNKITALVGLSGAGKSTLISLLDKFYEPQQGTIQLDGIDINHIDTQYLRDHIGLVLQKNHIFQGSIFENIRYGKTDASLEDVILAAQKASIHEQILQLPQAYDADALMLSGGQQQRIALARMFLKNPPIIFLDEPTASLDAIATEQIKQSLDEIKQGRTVIIISHSLSQIIDADYTYVMKDGRIAEHGEHDALYHQNGVYKEIFDAMAKSLNIEKIAKTYEDDAEEETHS
ncbi:MULTISPECIES: ABC transporter ATP-binding protein [Acinetobacter]|jgi:ABC-type multidrug transport system fused ATPase/permease subunit|uniref:ABC transporter ATP-binding protein n=1 Tax=Acinetobacter towneri TaxID=202956 RepID=A0AAP9GWS5_9GAMM|nr:MULTISPECIES: ABC transporter ATP-binding protein [Acinetobacter]MBT0886040.1 ABC transporter ATP-binding protein/permease [Acinetobacter towneri]MCA4789507.1 ABC transporter ATP-binding protein [Acinetobacter towneri]MCA4798612.1 ABC transporter ATP-binding protein [Acinetobacter towneri]MCO8058592.1 ABC transporter ATP-binding protein/permease [Acinetobacter towneri]MCO8064361.1 ABC transporter ATP-binding protein/permease [Acinetobacter towneri]